MRELNLKEKLAKYPHFRALMESYWRYVDRHGMAFEEEDCGDGTKRELSIGREKKYKAPI